MGTYTFKHENDDGFVEMSFSDDDAVTHIEITRRFVDFLNGCSFRITPCDNPDLDEVGEEQSKADKKRLKRMRKAFKEHNNG